MLFVEYLKINLFLTNMGYFYQVTSIDEYGSLTDSSLTSEFQFLLIYKMRTFQIF